MTQISEILEIVEKSRCVFGEQFHEMTTRGGIGRGTHVRHLTLRYHLTKNLHHHFLKVADHPRLSGRSGLQNFLLRFGIAVEADCKIAEVDFEGMGKNPLPCPLETNPWWDHFEQMVDDRPFVRLGAACVLEDLKAVADAFSHRLPDETTFFNKGNSCISTSHFPEILPCGDQIISALASAPLEPLDLEELVKGARTGSIFYLRMTAWAFQRDPLTRQHLRPYALLQRNDNGDEFADLDELIA